MKTRARFVVDRIGLFVLLLLGSLAAAVPARALNLVQDFYLPMPEAQLLQAVKGISSGITDTNMFMTTSILVTGDGTVIYYDQWEDGYETNLASPAQATTQIWGDGNDANGICPGFAHDPVGIPARTLITLTNNVSAPRNPAQILYDGADHIAANKALVITRAGWPSPTGPVAAGAAVVLSTLDYGTSFVSPVGEDMPQNDFQYVGLLVMAAQNGTTVTIDLDGPNGPTLPFTTNLNQGQSYLVNGGVQRGGTITTSKPAQANLICGDKVNTYTIDWFTLYPQSEWSSSYFAPVPSVVGGAAGGYAGTLFTTINYFYNPTANPITILYTNLTSAGSFVLPANGGNLYPMPTNSGASFTSAGGENFTVLTTVASNPTNNPTGTLDPVFNWGYTPLPKDSLTTEADVGWAPGSQDNSVNSSPVWVTPTGNTTIYVVFPGTNNAPLTDPAGGNYSASYVLQALQSLPIYAPGTNNDQSGMRIYTLDGTLLSVAWGEDPATAPAGNPGLDCGTTVLSFPVPKISKTANIINDVPPAGLSVGDTIQYTVQVDNKGLLPLGNTVIVDVPTPTLSYVANSATLNGIAIPDSTNGFPLGAPGYTITIIPGQTTSVFQYQDTVVGVGSVSNAVSVAGTSITASNSIPPGGGAPPLSKILYLSATNTPGVQALNRVNPAATAGHGTIRTSVDLVSKAPTFATIGLQTNAAGTMNNKSVVSFNLTTGTGSNALLLVGVSMNRGNNTAVTSVTYGSQSLTSVLGVTDSQNSRVEIWSLPAPQPGSRTVTVNYSGNVNSVVGAAVFTNVNLSAAPVWATNSSAGNTPATAAVTLGSSTNALVFNTVVFGDHGGTLSNNAGLQLWNQVDGGNQITCGGAVVPGAPSVTSSWTYSVANKDWAIGAVALSPATNPPAAGGTNATVFTQAPAFAAPFIIASNQAITVTTYITVTNGTLPIRPAITATLRANGTNFLTLSNPVYTQNAGVNSNLVWSTTNLSNVTIPAGQVISCVFSNNQAGTAFRINYDTTNQPSQISLPALKLPGNVILITGLGIYDAPYPGGSLAGSSPVGSTRYVRVSATDPFGSYDISSVNFAITGPGTNLNATVTNAVATTAYSATFEYVWPTGLTSGSNNIAVIANEGSEGIYDFAQTNFTLTGVADVAIVKSANPGVVAGNNLSYTLFVTNFGPSSASSVVVTDTLPAGVTYVSSTGSGVTNAGAVIWSLGTLTGGQGTNLTLVVGVPPGGVLTNVATVTTPTPDPNPTNNVTPPVVTTVTPSADVAVTNLVPGVLVAGTVYTNLITVTNRGPSVASNVVVVASGPGGVLLSNVVSVLPVGGVTNFTLLQTAPGTGPVTNSVTALALTGDPNLLNNTNRAVSAVTPAADVAIFKNANTNVVAGNNLSYTIVVTNAGPSAATNVVASDPLPAGAAYVSASGNSVTNAGVVSWNLGTLASGQATNLTLVVSAPAGGSLTNVASVSTPTGDPNPTNNVTPPVTTTVTPSADLAIGKSGPVGSVFGTNYNYTISVTNLGPSTATSLTVTDSLPAGLSFVSAVPTAITNAGNQVIWTNLGSLAMGAITNLTLVVNPTASGTVSNTASVGSPTSDPNPTNNLTPPVVTVVSKAPPLVTWPAPANIVYGTPLGTNQNNATSTVPGTLVYNPTNGTVLPVGTNTLTVVYTPTSTNYGPTNLSVVLVVTPAPLTVTANPATRTYGQTNPVFGGVLTGVVNGDPITATYATTATTGSAAGSYPIVPALADPNGRLGNYSVTTNSGVLTIAPAVLGITANDTNRVFGAANPTFTYTPSGFVLGDTTNVLSGSPGLTTAATTNSPVGSYPIVATNGTLSAANYVFRFTNGVLTVQLAAPQVTWPTPANIVYGTPLGTNQNNATSTVPGTFVYNPTNGTVLPVGTNTLTVVYTPASTNYGPTNLSVVLVVTPAPLTVTANPATRTYGQTNPVFGGVLTGVVNGDPITATYATTATTGSAAGSYPIVPALADPNGRLGNYSVTTNSGVLTIAPAVLGITANDTNRVFGAANPTFTYTPSGFVLGDTTNVLSGSPGLTTAATTNSPVGSYPIVATNGTLSAANYVFRFTNGVLTVQLAAPQVTWPTPANIVYGTPLGTNQNNATSTVPGTFVYNPTNGTVLPVGTNTLTVVYTPASTNYGPTNLSVVLVVTPAPLTVTANPATRTYGQTNPVFGGVLTGVVNGDPITATYATTATTGSAAGSYPIVPALADPNGRLGNYSVTTNSGVLTIAPAVLGITANDTNRVFGAANPTFTYTPSGFVLGDTTNVLSGSPGLTTAATTNSPVGSYPIVATNGTLSAANYVFRFTNGVLTVQLAAPQVTWPTPANIVYGTPLGTNQNNATSTVPGTLVYNPTNGTVLPVGTNTLTVVYTPASTNYGPTNLSVVLVVTPAPLTVTANPATRTYGQTNPVFGGVLTGVVNGDPITATYATTATTGSAAGSYPIVPALADPNGRLGNYSVTTNSGVLTIAPAVLGITANDTNRVFGAANPTFTYTPSGFVLGDTTNVLSGSPGLTTAATTNSPVGSYPIVATNGTLSAANYVFRFTNGVLTVQLAAPQVTWPAPANIVYGTPLGTNQNNATSTVPGTLVYNPTNGTVLPVGTNTLTVVYTPTSTNYGPTNLSVVLVVTPAPLTVTANPATRTYGQTNPVFGGVLTGVVNGDPITATYSSAATTGSAAGSYPIVPALADPNGRLGNYSVTTNSGVLTIAPAVLGITANDTNRVFGAANPSFTYTPSGFVLGDTTNVLSGSPGLTTVATTNSPVGSYPIVATNGTLSAANYVFRFTNGVLTVQLAAPQVTWPAPANIVYGTPLGTNQNNATSTVPGTFVYNPTNGTVLPVGTNTLTVVYTPTSTNYGPTNLSVVLVVTPAPLTVTANPATRTYGQTNPVFGGVLTGVVNGDPITATYATTATTGSAAGSYPIVPALADPNGRLGNYSVTTNSGVLTIAPAVLGITANDTNRVFGAANPTFTYTPSGFVLGDTTNVLSGSPGLTTAATTNSPVGSYPIVATNGTLSAANYVFRFTNGVLTVQLAAPQVTWPTPANIVYGTPLGTNQNNATSTVPGTLVYNPTNGTVLPVGTNTLTVVYTPASTNYGPTNLSVVLVVTPAPLTVTANPATRTYGQTNPVFGGVLTGVVNGDPITATYATTATTGSAAGSYPIVPALADPNGRLGNYSVTTNSGVLTIAPAVLGITANDTNRVFGAANPSFTYTPSGFVLGDTTNVLSGSPGLTTAATTNSPVGSYPIVATNGTLSAANYVFRFTNGVLTVQLAAPQVTWPAPANIVYGTPLGTNQNNATSTVPGTFVYNPTNGTVLPVGTNTLTVVYTPTSTNYGPTNLSVVLVVTPAPLTVTANPATRTYGQTNPVFGGVLTGVVNGDPITATYATTATTGSAAGSYPIVPALADPNGRLGNYSVTTNSGVLTIAPAVLGITANDTNRVFGAANPTFTYTPSGFVLGDTTNVLSGSPGLTTAATTNSPVGSYPIVATNGTLSAANYVFRFTNGVLTVQLAAPQVTWPTPANIVYGTPLGTNQNNATSTVPGTLVYNPTNGTVLPVGTNTLTVVYTPASTNYGPTNLSVVLVVTPAPLTVTANPATRTYGQTNPVFGGVLTGVVNGDPITATYSSAATTGSAAGSYPIVPALADPNGRLGNYSVTTNSGVLTIAPAVLGITANDTNRVFGAANPTFTYTPSGFVLGDTTNVLSGSPGLTTAATTNSPVGSYPIVATNGTLSAANYVFRFTNGVLTVQLAAPQVTWPTPANIVYGTPLGTNQNNATSTVPGTFVYNPTNGTVLPVGTNTLTVVYTPASTNYGPTNLSVVLVVTPAPLTVTANPATRTYGQTNPVFGGVLTGVVNGDPITATYATTATTGSAAGSYPIVPALADPNGRLGNYSVTTNSGVLTIAPAVLGITANDTNRVFGAANPTFTYTPSGFVLGDTTNVLSGSPGLTTVATTNSPVGSYPIVATNGTLSAANYVFRFTNGVLTVQLAAPQVTWPAPANIVYGTPLGTNQNNASATVPGTLVYNPTNGTVLPVGTNTLTVVYTPASTNYGPTNLSVGLVVTPAPLTVTANNQVKVAGTLLTLGSGQTAFTSSGLVNNETIGTVTLASTGAAAAAVAGTYPIVPSAATGGTFSPANYGITYSNGTLTVTSTADLVVVQKGPTNGVAGSNLVFTVAVTNLGPSTATNLVVTDQLAAGFTYVSASGAGTNSSGLVTWLVASLPLNGVTNLTVTAYATEGGTFTNIAAGACAVPDLNPTNNNGSLPNARVRTVISALADVAVFKTGGASVYAGQPVSYVLTATNAGPSTAANVAVLDTLPAGAAFQSASPGYSISNGVVAWSGLTLAPGAATNLSLTLVALPSASSLLNIASGTSPTADPNPTNNNGSDIRSRVTTQVVPSADVVVLLTGPASVVQGSNFVYQLVITNAGPSTSSNVLVSDSLPTNFVFITASGGGSLTNGLLTWPLVRSLPAGGSTNYTITVNAANAGIFTNIASALALTYDPNLTNNSGVSPASRAQTTVAPAQLSVLAGVPVFNPQTGLYEESVTVTNGGSGTILGFRLFVGGLTNTVTLYNATGTTNGVPFVDYRFPLDPSSAVSLILEFLNPTRLPFSSTLSVEPILPDSISSTNSNDAVPVTRVFTDTRNDELRFVVEFASVPGKIYAVIYSSDLLTWKVATPSIKAAANITQWYDDGPPKTESLPASAPQRFYRVIQF